MLSDAPPPQTSLFDKIKSIFGSKVYNFEEPEAYYPPKFESDDPKLVEFFDENGYAVIKNAATAEEVQTGIRLFWDLVERQQPEIKRDNPATWRDDIWVASARNGIMAGYGIGQSEFLWHARRLPKVKEAFSKIWDTDDLLVSYDGCGVFRPVEYEPTWKTNGGWYHIDQNVYNKKGRHAVQGLLNLYPSGPYDGGFVCVPKSHHMVDEAFEKYDDICSKKARDYIRLPAGTPFWMEAANSIKRDATNKYDLLPVKLVLEPGDFVLWDSRTIHCNHPVTKPDPSPQAKTQLKRLVAYICMTPTSLAKDIEKLLKFRVFAFHMGVTTTHWPHDFQPTFTVNGKPTGIGASVVKLSSDEAKLIRGDSHNIDVYDESFIAGISLKDL